METAHSPMPTRNIEQVFSATLSATKTAPRCRIRAALVACARDSRTRYPCTKRKPLIRNALLVAATTLLPLLGAELLRRALSYSEI